MGEEAQSVQTGGSDHSRTFHLTGCKVREIFGCPLTSTVEKKEKKNILPSRNVITL